MRACDFLPSSDHAEIPAAHVRRRLVGLMALAPWLGECWAIDSRAATPDAPTSQAISPTSSETYLGRTAASMSRGQWVPLSRPEGLSADLFKSRAGTTLGYIDKACHDPVHRQLRFIGVAHYGDQRFHQYDETSHGFSNLPDPPWDDGGDRSPSFIGHGYQHNTIDPATGDFYFRIYGSKKVHRLIRATGEWRLLAPAPNTAITGGLEWVPSIGTAGGLILYLGESCHRWDKATDTWTTPEYKAFPGQTYHTVAVRSAPTETVVFGGGNAGRRLWRIGADGGAAPIPDCPIPVGINASVTTSCPVSGDVLVFGPDNTLASFRLSVNRWSTDRLPADAPNFGRVGKTVKRIVAASMPTYGAVFFLFGATPDVWLYKHA